jgi:hypothetical protein
MMYAYVSTRPNITMVVSHLKRYMANPCHAHWEHAKRVFRNIKGTANASMVYGSSVQSSETKSYTSRVFQNLAAIVPNESIVCAFSNDGLSLLLAMLCRWRMLPSASQ